MNTVITLPSPLLPLIRHLEAHHIRPILVGGFIRDRLLGLTSKDIDMECYGALTLEALADVITPLGRVNRVGKSFGVLKLKLGAYDIDLSLPRTESKTGKGHKGFEVKTFARLDFKTAAKRRDFTVNAIGYDPTKQAWHDPFNGISDLKHRRLRCVDPSTFIEDPLRVLRAVQFSARFKLTPDKQLVTLSNTIVSSGMLNELPKERIFEEIKKMLLKAKTPSTGLHTIKTLGVDRFFKSFSSWNDSDRSLAACCMDAMVLLTQTTDVDPMALMLTSLCAPFESIGRVESLLDQLTDDKRLRTNVVHYFRHRRLAMQLYTARASNVEIMQAACTIRLDIALLLARCQAECDRNDKTASQAVPWLDAAARRLGVLQAPRKPILGGDDLIEAGLRPSARFKSILEQAYLTQLEGHFTDKNGAQRWLRLYLHDLGKS